MAQFCARVRKRADLPSVSMKDIYQHPTIRPSGGGPGAGVAGCGRGVCPASRRRDPRRGAGRRAWALERVSVDSHFFDDLGADSMVMARFCARVRKRADLPSVSMKDIYQHPTVSSLAAALAPAPPLPAGPRTSAEARSREVLADVVGVEQVSVDSHFFDDLGADSMVMARFCARVRKRADLPSVSMKDIYQHPTISSLAAALRRTPPPAGSSAVGRIPAPADGDRAAGPARLEYVLCGALQLLIFLGYSYLAALVVVQGYEWISAGSGRGRHLPAVGRCSAPRSSSACASCRSWRSGCSSGGGSPSEIRVWSLAYFRFWLVKTLVRSNPLVAVRRFAAVPALPAGTGREGRAGRRDPLQERAGVHRPAHHRRRHGHPQGLVLHRLPGRTPA